MAVEVIVNVENRKVALDIEPANLKGLKMEFDEWCAEDEAMTKRRLSYAPVFSMDTKMEIKRKYIFRGGENIYVSWSPLQLETLNESEIPAASPPKHHQLGSVQNESNTLDSGPAETPVVDEAPPKVAAPASAEGTSKSPCSSLFINTSDSESLSESDDDQEYGEEKEYYTDAEWSKMPKYLKYKEKCRFQMHEERNKRRAERGDSLLPFEPDVLSKKTNLETKDMQSSKRTRQSKDSSDEGKSTQKRKPPQSNLSFGKCNTRNSMSARQPEAQASNVGQDKHKENSDRRPLRTVQNDSEPGPSKEGGGLYSSEDLLKIKPELPQYNVPEILEALYGEGNDHLQKCIDVLKSEGIVFNKERAFIVRLLTRHLYYKIAKSPREVSGEMREGLAKSIVLHYPKFQIKADEKTTFPWDCFYARGLGRGWIANSARSIQKKFRTRKSKSKKKSAIVINPDNTQVDETIRTMGLMMPGRAEKSEIIRGMRSTFEFRQDARKQQMAITTMLQEFPHLASYDGEILQTEFKLIHPDAHDLCKSFQDHLPGILALPSCNIETPIEDDTLKALLLLAHNLPKDMRVKGDPKKKSPKADLKDLVEVVQLGQDIDTFICDKIEAACGSIQPYLILVKSPLNNKITRFFLVLDYKPVQIASGSIVKALDMLVKSYFVFNVRYPLGWRATFHCLAACFSNVFEKGLKRPDAVTPSEHELLKKISKS